MTKADCDEGPVQSAGEDRMSLGVYFAGVGPISRQGGGATRHFGFRKRCFPLNSLLASGVGY